MQRMTKTSAMQRIEKNLNFLQYRVTVWGVSSRSTLTDGPSRQAHQSFAQLPQSEGAEPKVSLSNDEECGIARFNINAVSKNFEKNFTPNIIKPTRQKEGNFKAKMQSATVIALNQTAFQSQEVTFH